MRIKKAKTNLYDFVKLFHEEAGFGPYVESRFAQEVCAELETLAQQIVADREQHRTTAGFKCRRPKKMIFAPPQNGKSVLLKLFCAYCYFKWPWIRIAGASYSMELASTIIKDVQRIMETPLYKREFYDPEFRTCTSEKFVTKDFGQYIAVGVNGPLTGKNYEIGIIDDPYKDLPSNTDKRAVETWYDTVFSTRQNEYSGQIMILTRWATDDLAAYLEQNDMWDIHSYPAIQADGTALTAFKSLDFLMEQKAHLPASRWASLYMQTPIVEGGEVIKTSDFKYYEGVPKLAYIFSVSDTNIAGKTSADYSVNMTVGRATNGDYYILDLWRKQATFPETKRALEANYHKYRPTKLFRCLFLEAAASGIQLIDVFKEERIPVRPVKPIGSKYFRLSVNLWKIENGYVHLPKGAPWLADFLAECEAFRADEKHAHDDQVDCLAYAISDQCEIGTSRIKMNKTVLTALYS